MLFYILADADQLDLFYLVDRVLDEFHQAKALKKGETDGDEITEIMPTADTDDIYVRILSRNAITHQYHINNVEIFLFSLIFYFFFFQLVHRLLIGGLCFTAITGFTVILVI